MSNRYRCRFLAGCCRHVARSVHRLVVVVGLNDRRCLENPRGHQAGVLHIGCTLGGKQSSNFYIPGKSNRYR